MHSVNKPEVFDAGANEKILNGKVIDEKTKAVISKLMQSLTDFKIRLHK
jgi:hypothetical protein